MSNRVVHFEIHAGDVARAQQFYGDIFGWQFQDWSEYAGMPYFGIVTGEEGEPGIDGGLMQRQGDGAGPGAPVNGAVLTIGVGNYDAIHERILAAGGMVALPKYALPGMAWQGYYLDPDGNVFGIHQPDENAG
ncbi:MAG: hypothetical protein KDD92_17510 [Caldilineaceae bacterium]|nr:hypothetical protein [Caldilineaceae bacterium]